MNHQVIFTREDPMEFGVTYQTTNYEIFRWIEGNRDTIESNVLKLAEDIPKHGQLTPALVSHDLYVIDGQNRIAACEKLKRPVLFQLLDLNGEDLIEFTIAANTMQRNWGWKNFLRAYCQRGNEFYLSYQKLLRRFDLDHTAMLTVIFNRFVSGATSIFNRGELRIKNINDVIDRFERIEKYWILISRAYSNMPGKNRNRPPAKLIKALIRLMSHQNFNHDIMLGKLKNDITGLVGINTTEGFTSELIRIYNRRTAEEEKLNLE